MLVAVLACGSAHAGRPLVTEDAGVLERGSCEFEAVAARQSLVGPSERSGLLQIACGAGLQTQLAAALGSTRVEGEHSLQAAATGKTFLRELTEEQAGLALAYVFSGARPSGMGWRYDTTALLGVITVPVQKELLLHGNLGASYSRIDRETTAVWALAAELLQLRGTGFDVTAETFGTQREPPWLNFGLRYTLVPERFNVNASYGWQGGSERAKLATVGLKLNF
jgi:hypothetical protein